MEKQSIDVRNYMLDDVQVPQNTNCNSKNSFYVNNTTNCSVRHRKNEVVDIESKLKGLDKYLDRYEPPPKKENSYSTPQKQKVEHFKSLEGIGTREKRPSNTLSGITIDRFEYPLRSPQNLDVIVFDEKYRGGFQTRIDSKDCSVANCGKSLKLKPAYGSRCSNYTD